MQFELIQTQKTARNKRQTSFVPIFRAEIARAFPGFSSRINIHGGPHAGWISGQFCVPPTARRSGSLPFLVYALLSGFREKSLSETRMLRVFKFSATGRTCLSYSLIKQNLLPSKTRFHVVQFMNALNSRDALLCVYFSVANIIAHAEIRIARKKRRV